MAMAPYLTRAVQRCTSYMKIVMAPWRTRCVQGVHDGRSLFCSCCSSAACWAAARARWAHVEKAAAIFPVMLRACSSRIQQTGRFSESIFFIFFCCYHARARVVHWVHGMLSSMVLGEVLRRPSHAVAGARRVGGRVDELKKEEGRKGGVVLHERAGQMVVVVESFCRAATPKRSIGILLSCQVSSQ